MFGFIQGPCASCHSTEHAVWRGAFCGMAKELSGGYGLPAKLLANRDATFLGLLGLSLDPESARWPATTCCNPFARPYPIATGHPALAYAAAVSVCGLSAKLEDDGTDERGLRRLGARAARRLTAPAVDRAIAWLNQRSFPTARVLELLAGQDRAESAGSDPSQADAPTRQSFGLIAGFVAELCGRPEARPALTRWGEAHGSLVYWQDALDDQARDQRAGRFNPLSLLSAETVRARMSLAWQDFQEGLAALPAVRHAAVIGEIGRCTALHHAQTREERREERRQRREARREHRKKRNCCDCDDCLQCGNLCEGCSCCFRHGASTGKAAGGCLDRCFDCGPGDTGCIDCCPCDGCDCCPCHCH